MTAPVALDRVSKSYGRLCAVRDVSFSLPAGEIVALVGHNGAGKTTLMKLMLGLVHPSGGVVRVLGGDPAAGGSPARRRLGYLPENVAFNDALTGRETLAFYARLKGESAAASQALLEKVGLGEAARRRVGGYSKGMRQRLGLAQALLGNPSILLLDEPTTGLDPAFRQSFYETVQRLRDRGATVLLSSHALTELEERADRVIVMNRGTMVANGTLAELRRLAQLPTRMLITMSDRNSVERAIRSLPSDRVRRVNGHAVEVTCAEQDKMQVFRLVAAHEAGVADLEMLTPGLDELYAHFLRTGEDAR
jgi:Cu-processing system ATP-binding protein